jgi:hypothetical protein
MITKKQFEKLQHMLGITNKSPQRKTNAPYKKLLYCGGCGGSVTFEEKWQIICGNCKHKFAVTKTRENCPECDEKIEGMKDKKLLHYAYYHCTKKTTPNCTEGSIRLEELEKTVDSELAKFEISPKLRDWAIEHLNELSDIEIEDRETITSNINSALEDVEKRIDNLMRLYI